MKTGSRLLAALLVLGLAACAQPPVPQDRFFRLQVEAPQSAAAALDGVVEVDRLGAEGLTAGRAIVYTDASSPNLAQEFFYDFWVEPPGDMLRDILVKYLRNAGVADALITPDSRANSDFNLVGRINRLEIVRGDAPLGVAEIEFSLTSSATGKLLMVKNYVSTVAVSDGSVPAGVGAINEGISQIFNQLTTDLRNL